MRILVFIVIITTSLFALSGCKTNNNPSDPVVIVATDAPPDTGFVDYRHQSGVFSLRVPPNWVVDNLPSDDTAVRVQFSVLEGTQSVVRLTVYVVNTGNPMTRETFLNSTVAYQPPADMASFDWKPIGEPIDQADGSRRITGVRVYPISGTRTMNIFMQGNGSYFSALEVDVTDADEATLYALRTVINTYRVNTDVSLDIADVAASTSFTGDVGFDNFVQWSDADGGFNITGRVINLTDTPLEAVRLTGYLFDSRNNELSEKSLIVTTDVVVSGGSAPFRIRFEGGRPSTAVRYELHAAARTADIVRNKFYGSENFTIEQNPAFYNTNGNLVLSGQLVNIGTRVVNNVKVVVGVLDDEENVVASETAFIDKDRLLPAEVGNYQIVIYDVGGPAVRYELTVMGQSE